MSRLSTFFGHEENLSRVIARDGHLKRLLQQLDVELVGTAELEKPVLKGHDDRQGRLDIYQPSSVGDVIVEVQYGKADYHHADRLQNYASNFVSTALVVWIAESFSNDSLHRFKRAKTPVYCIKASLKDGLLVLTPRTPKAEVLNNQEIRIRQAKRKTQELIEVLHKIQYWRFSEDEDWSQITPDNLSGFGVSPENCLKEYIDYQLKNYPRKTRQFLWTSPEFQGLKESLLDELAIQAVNTLKSAESNWVDNFLRVSGVFDYTEEEHEERRQAWWIELRRKRQAMRSDSVQLEGAGPDAVGQQAPRDAQA